MLRVAIPGEQKTFEILVFDTVGQSRWPLNNTERQKVLNHIHAEFKAAVTKYNGEYRNRMGDGAVAYFPTEQGGNLGVQAGKYFLSRRENIHKVIRRSHHDVRPEFRVLLTRGEVACADEPGADSGTALNDVMKNEKQYGKENTFRLLEPAYNELNLFFRREFGKLRRRIRGYSVYELKRLKEAKPPTPQKALENELEYYKFFANMTVTNLAARNNITSYLIKQTRAFKSNYRKDPGEFIKHVFDTREFVSVVLDSVYLFFTKTFRSAKFWVTFWTPHGPDKIGVADYKYPPRERCVTFDRKIGVDPNKVAAGYSYGMNEMLLIPDLRRTKVPFDYFYVGQEKKKNIRSMACFPVSGSLTGLGDADLGCSGVLCVCTDKSGLFNPEDRYVYISHISSYVLNLELACEIQKKGVM